MLEHIAGAVSETSKIVEAGKTIIESVKESKFDIDIDDKIDISEIGEVVEQDNDIIEDADNISDINIDDKIEIKTIFDVLNEYVQDLKKLSEFPETILDMPINIDNLEIISQEVNKKMKEKFDDIKDQLRKQWEQKYDIEWPRYKEDVYDSNGKIIRYKGDRYDVHHIQPLELGGQNTLENITPMAYNEHVKIHSKHSPCNKLKDFL